MDNMILNYEAEVVKYNPANYDFDICCECCGEPISAPYDCDIFQILTEIYLENGTVLVMHYDCFTELDDEKIQEIIAKYD